MCMRTYTSRSVVVSGRGFMGSGSRSMGSRTIGYRVARVWVSGFQGVSVGSRVLDIRV
jgi:hypothetical protein